MRNSEAELDVAPIGEALTTIREALEVIRALKTQLTGIGAASTNVSTSLDKLRTVIVASIEQAERAIAARA